MISQVSFRLIQGDIASLYKTRSIIQQSGSFHDFAHQTLANACCFVQQQPLPYSPEAMDVQQPWINTALKTVGFALIFIHTVIIGVLVRLIHSKEPPPTILAGRITPPQEKDNNFSASPADPASPPSPSKAPIDDDDLHKIWDDLDRKKVFLLAVFGNPQRSLPANPDSSSLPTAAQTTSSSKAPILDDDLHQTWDRLDLENIRRIAGSTSPNGSSKQHPEKPAPSLWNRATAFLKSKMPDISSLTQQAQVKLMGKMLGPMMSRQLKQMILFFEELEKQADENVEKWLESRTSQADYFYPFFLCHQMPAISMIQTSSQSELYQKCEDVAHLCFEKLRRLNLEKYLHEAPPGFAIDTKAMIQPAISFFHHLRNKLEQSPQRDEMITWLESQRKQFPDKTLPFLDAQDFLFAKDSTAETFRTFLGPDQLKSYRDNFETCRDLLKKLDLAFYLHNMTPENHEVHKKTVGKQLQLSISFFNQLRQKLEQSPQRDQVIAWLESQRAQFPNKTLPFFYPQRYLFSDDPDITALWASLDPSQLKNYQDDFETCSKLLLKLDLDFYLSNTTLEEHEADKKNREKHLQLSISFFYQLRKKLEQSPHRDEVIVWLESQWAQCPYKIPPFSSTRNYLFSTHPQITAQRARLDPLQLEKYRDDFEICRDMLKKLDLSFYLYNVTLKIQQEHKKILEMDILFYKELQTKLEQKLPSDKIKAWLNTKGMLPFFATRGLLFSTLHEIEGSRACLDPERLEVCKNHYYACITQLEALNLTDIEQLKHFFSTQEKFNQATALY